VATTTPERIDTTGPAQEVQLFFRHDPQQPIREIDAQQAWAAYGQKLPFLDARRSSEFRRGHVPGAWNAPVWESDVDTRITTFEAYVHPDLTAPLVVYCDGQDCQDSHLLASKLLTLGYRNLLVYRGGYPEWMQTGRPVTQGDAP
jgi:rhodanese-related sulfurtransferase